MDVGHTLCANKTLSASHGGQLVRALKNLFQYLVKPRASCANIVICSTLVACRFFRHRQLCRDPMRTNARRMWWSCVTAISFGAARFSARRSWSFRAFRPNSCAKSPAPPRCPRSAFAIRKGAWTFRLATSFHWERRHPAGPIFNADWRTTLLTHLPTLQTPSHQSGNHGNI